MGKDKTNEKLYKQLRASGVRKKVSKKVANALPKKGNPNPMAARRAAGDLKAAGDEIIDLVKGGPEKRSKAAKKAAKTRKAKADKRSKAAKKAAKTKAKS